MTTEMVKLDALMARRNGSVNPAKFLDEEFELHSIPAFDAGRPDFVNGSQIGSSKQVVQPNDVMISKIVPHIRRASVVGGSSGRRQIASGEWIVFRSERIFPNYLRQVLVSDDFNAKFMNTVAGVGGSLLRARPAEVAKIKIPLPPIPEQRRIAAILDKADALRAKRREAIAKLELLLQSVFLEMFGDPGRNPKDWPQLALGTICSNEDFKRKPIKKADREEREGPYPYYGASGIIDSFDDYIFDGERLLVAEDGANLVVRSTPVAFIARGQYWVNNHAHVLAESEHADLRFIEQALVLMDLKPYITGSAQPKLNQSNLERILLPMPPIKLQKKFREICEKLESEKQHVVRQDHGMDFLCQSLQQQAFAGEL